MSKTYEAVLLNESPSYEVKTVVKCKICSEVISSRSRKQHQLNHDGDSSNHVCLHIFNFIEFENEFINLKDLINKVCTSIKLNQYKIFMIHQSWRFLLRIYSHLSILVSQDPLVGETERNRPIKSNSIWRPSIIKRNFSTNKVQIETGYSQGLILMVQII